MKNMKMKRGELQCARVSSHQRGISLLTILLILLIVSLLGTASVQITMMSERSARNDRDMDLAWQAAEMGLVGAEIELQGPNKTSNSRTSKILSGPPYTLSETEAGCYTSGVWKGFCSNKTKINNKTRPTWLAVDISETEDASPSVEFGTFTGQSYASAGQDDGKGIQPAYKPRYIIETMPIDSDRSNSGAGMVGYQQKPAEVKGPDAKTGDRLYRVTSLGFGPRKDIQAVVQILYRN